MSWIDVLPKANQKWKLTLMTTEVIMEDGKRYSISVRPEDYEAYVEALKRARAAWRDLVEHQLGEAAEYQERMQNMRKVYETMYGGLSSNGLSSDSNKSAENGPSDGLVHQPALGYLPAVGADSALEEALYEDGPRWPERWR